MTRQRFNRALGVLSAALSTTDTTMTSDGLASLGVVSGTDYAALTLFTATGYEIVYVTAHTAGATTATITRAQEGTTALTFDVGARWLHGPTSGDFVAPSKADLGLGNVDNTSDVNKPVSTATAVALANTSTLDGTQTISGVKTLSAAGQALKITPTGNAGASTSTGGAALLDNSGSTGAGAVVYSNRGADAAGRTLVVNNANAANPQASLHVAHAGTGDAQTIAHTGTGRGLVVTAAGGGTASKSAVSIGLTGSGSATSSALSVSSANSAHSTLEVSGVESGRGTIKVSHIGDGTDTNASTLSLDLRGLDASTPSAAQGIFIDSTIGGTTGKLLNVRNKGVDQLVLTPLAGMATSTLTVSGDLRATGLYDTNNRVFSATNPPAKTDVGLGNVDNTSDVNKPVSTATTAAITAAVAAKTPDTQTFTASGTWTKPTGVTVIQVAMVSGGGGGGSGRRGATGSVRAGGGAGGGGGYSFKMYRAVDLPASMFVTVGSGGVGGAAPTTDDTNGNLGGVGNGCAIGAANTNLRVNAGGAGGAGSTTGGTAGAAGSGTIVGTAGGAGSAGVSAGSSGFASTAAGSGGGGGGGVTAANVESAGGTSFSPADLASSSVAGGAVGGNPGGVASFRQANHVGGGTGGGGGGGNASGGGGAGGNAEIYGGGGGGAGGGTNGATGGAGGNGGPGIVQIISW